MFGEKEKLEKENDEMIFEGKEGKLLFTRYDPAGGSRSVTAVRRLS